MAKDISISAVTVATSKGPKKYYSFDVIDPKTGMPVKSYNTTDEQKAKKFYEQAKKDYPDATVNGEKDADPLSDGTLPSQGEYDLGGFEKGDKKVNPWDPDPKDIQPELNNFNPDDAQAAAQRSSEGSRPPGRKSKIKKLPRDRSYMKWKNVGPWLSMTKVERNKKKITGTFGTMRTQPKVDRPKADSEDVRRGKDNNAFIVIGNDRVEKLNTGYGGKGHTQCDAIDIVAGMGAHQPKEVENRKPLKDGVGEVEKEQNPNFFVDAARIYISQKTDVDRNFGLGKFKATVEDEEDVGKYGAKSAIAAKADNIRLIARESLHLVTGTDTENSQGGTIYGKTGIELVAMNLYKDLQPMVLGDNLQLALLTIIDNIEAIAKIMHGYIKYQMKYNQALQQHTHITHFYGKSALQSKEAIIAGIQCDIETASKTEISVMKHITNLQGLKSSFLIESGDSFINSRYNKCN